MCKHETTRRNVVRRGVITHADTVPICYLHPRDCYVGTVFRCIVHISARSVTWFSLDGKTFPNMYARNILVCRFLRYLLLALELTSDNDNLLCCGPPYVPVLWISCHLFFLSIHLICRTPAQTGNKTLETKELIRRWLMCSCR